MADELSPSNGNGGPWWVKILTQVGVPAGIAIFLVYFLAWEQSARMASIDASLVKANYDMSQFVKDQNAATETQRRAADTTTRLLRSICQNTAKNDAAREACLAR
jgi:hypothetical protein